MNPLEEVLRKVKAFLTNNGAAYPASSDARTLVAMAFNSISQNDCLKYIKHAGYME